MTKNQGQEYMKDPYTLRKCSATEENGQNLKKKKCKWPLTCTTQFNGIHSLRKANWTYGRTPFQLAELENLKVFDWAKSACE